MFRPGPPPRRGRPEGAPIPEYSEPMFLFDGTSVPDKGIRIPVMSVIGNKDGYQFPINDSPNCDMMIRNLNLWARINGVPEIDPAVLDGFSGSSEEEKLIGIPLSEGCGSMKHADGIDYAIGDLKDSNGIAMVRIVCEDNVPHWPTPELSRLVFEFFSHFSRDTKTHSSVYTK